MILMSYGDSKFFWAIPKPARWGLGGGIPRRPRSDFFASGLFQNSNNSYNSINFN